MSPPPPRPLRREPAKDSSASPANTNRSGTTAGLVSVQHSSLQRCWCKKCRQAKRRLLSTGPSLYNPLGPASPAQTGRAPACRPGPRRCWCRAARGGRRTRPAGTGGTSCACTAPGTRASQSDPGPCEGGGGGITAAGLAQKGPPCAPTPHAPLTAQALPQGWEGALRLLSENWDSKAAGWPTAASRQNGLHRWRQRQHDS